MGAKGTKDCCCRPCTVRSGCVLPGGAVGELENHCCRCVPRFSCLTAYDSEGAVIETASVEFDCIGWDHIFTCEQDGAPVSVDVDITFLKDETDNTCEICLSSEALGLTGDSKDCQPMAPPYNDAETKREACLAPLFEWDVSGYSGADCNIASIVLSFDEFTERPFTPVDLGDDCAVQFKAESDRVCITVDDGYTQTVDTVCEYQSKWEFDRDGDPAKYVRITRQTNDKLTLQSYLGNDATEVDVSCPSYSYTWTMPAGETITLIGDRMVDCTDCTCHCTNLCVTFTSSQSGSQRQIVVGPNYEGDWPIEDTATGFAGLIALSCEGCTFRQTTVGISSSTHSSGGESSSSVLCPDQIEGTWYFDLGGGEILTVEVACQLCDSCPPTTVLTDCCETPVSKVLYATISDESDCANLDGEVVQLVNDGEVGCWSGSGTFTLGAGQCTVNFSIQCGEGGLEWVLSDQLDCGSTLATASVSDPCSPLSVTFSNVGAGGCCDGGISSDYSVTVTE